MVIISSKKETGSKKETVSKVLMQRIRFLFWSSIFLSQYFSITETMQFTFHSFDGGVLYLMLFENKHLRLFRQTDWCSLLSLCGSTWQSFCHLLLTVVFCWQKRMTCSGKILAPKHPPVFYLEPPFVIIHHFMAVLFPEFFGSNRSFAENILSQSSFWLRMVCFLLPSSSCTNNILLFYSTGCTSTHIFFQNHSTQWVLLLSKNA